MGIRVFWALTSVWLASSPALAANVSADAAYQVARKAYQVLKRDPARRKFRHHWLNVVHRFEGVAAKYPKSPRAPDALFTAGELLRELSHISRVREDLDEAIGDYKQLCDRYPHHHLADDAALGLARINVDRWARPEAARRILKDGILKNPRGDRIPEMKSLLASLDRESEKQSDRRASLLPSGSAQPLNGRRPGAEAATNAKETEAAQDSPLESSTPSQIVPAPAEPLQDALKPPIAKEPAEDRSEPPARSAQRSNDDEAAPGPPALPENRKVRPIRPTPEMVPRPRRVVIDAGHGGHDTGAIGPGGTLEKDVSLAIAHRLVRILTGAGLKVLLTRSTDVFIPLEDRARIANEAKGDLFISIHCNSGPTGNLHGIETYTLNTSSNHYAIRLAARENASSERRISDVQFILADLATKADADESLLLAHKVQRSLVAQLKTKHSDIKDLGTKQALFYVLLGTKMPAILVETSFLSNKEEEKRLASPSYQSEVATAIGSAVQDFLGDRRHLAERD